MIKISRQVDYALQLIFALNKAKYDIVSLKTFSEESNISFLFLQKIARQLRKQGLIESVKGPVGGYKLKTKFEDITLKQIIEAADGYKGLTKCSHKQEDCLLQDKCRLKSGIFLINKKLDEYLDGIKLISLVNNDA